MQARPPKNKNIGRLELACSGLYAHCYEVIPLNQSGSIQTQRNLSIDKLLKGSHSLHCAPKIVIVIVINITKLVPESTRPSIYRNSWRRTRPANIWK